MFPEGKHLQCVFMSDGVAVSLRESPEAFMASLDALRSRHGMDGAMLTTFMSAGVAVSLRESPESFMASLDALRSRHGMD